MTKIVWYEIIVYHYFKGSATLHLRFPCPSLHLPPISSQSMEGKINVCFKTTIHFRRQTSIYFEKYSIFLYSFLFPLFEALYVLGLKKTKKQWRKKKIKIEKINLRLQESVLVLRPRLYCQTPQLLIKTNNFVHIWISLSFFYCWKVSDCRHLFMFFFGRIYSQVLKKW